MEISSKHKNRQGHPRTLKYMNDMSLPENKQCGYEMRKEKNIYIRNMQQNNENNYR